MNIHKKGKFWSACLSGMLSLMAAVISCSGKPDSSLKDGLAAALAANDLAAINGAVAAIRENLADQAGVPEVVDEYFTILPSATVLSKTEAQRGFTAHFDQLQRLCWWRADRDPTRMTAPLRAAASVVTGTVAVNRAQLDGKEHCLEIAKEAGDFLCRAQEQAGAGCYPFPAARGTSKARAMEVATHFLQNAERDGRLGAVVRNGWIIDDLGDGGLQFDNGECGVAMLDLYELTKESKYLGSARKAADWALAQPLCVNWNYNSFSVRLLARAHAVMGDRKYLDAAVRKARLGVIPGQLLSGPRAGRWVDAHNARPTYHYIMMAALGELAAVMPAGHEHRAEILRALKLGLVTRNAEMISRGIMNKDCAMDALLEINRVFANDPAFLEETKSTAALRALALVVSDEIHKGKSPPSPGNWGRFLEYAVRAGQ